MRLNMNLLFWAHIFICGSTQATATFPLAGTSGSPHLPEDGGTEAPQSTLDPPVRHESTTQTHAERTVHSQSLIDVAPTVHTTKILIASTDVPMAISDAAHFLSSLPPGLKTDSSITKHSSSLTGVSLTALQSGVSHAPSTPMTPGHLETPALGRAPAGHTHQEAPFEFNVGDEEHKRSPLDPLLAALLSAVIVVTAIVFVILFLKFRQKTNHPEFHRLQDLPMDDLMEDTPLSRYSY
ncbi:uncharacterized protein LOC114478960 [Gouania willdenowi]|uniref:uncharacterized protein LOC114478960 n=1 Tax=Gouania willdenowi TaxID=441366 RepID=UPI0010566034|nr:uncharacterized protein LOC114478960 [Gouania willdenowi]